MTTPDLILHNGHIVTLDRANPVAEAVAVKDGKFTSVGRKAEILPLAGEKTRVIDLRGRQVLPGLVDNHFASHPWRAELQYGAALGWGDITCRGDGYAQTSSRHHPAATMGTRVGGFTEHQFPEKRLPTIEELNAVAPETPVFILHLYDRALLNAVALRAVGYTKDTSEPPGGEIVRDAL